MPFADDLLEQARHLANREPKRPKQASLRRAVSAAYYALFHLLTTEMAKNWKRAADRAEIARIGEHAKMRSACERQRSRLNEYFKTKPAVDHQQEVAEHLRRVTNAFVLMNEHRANADYNNATKWTRTDTLEKIESVEAAFRSWRKIREESEAKDFLVTLIVKERR